MMGSVMQKAVGAALVCALFCVIWSGCTDSIAAEPSRAATAAPVVGSGIAEPSSDAPSAQVVMEKLAHSPAVFIENQGQWEDETIRFALSSMGANVGLTEEGVRFQIFQRESQDVASASGGCLTTGRSKMRQSRYGDGTMPEPLTQSKRRMLEFAARFEGARRVVPEGQGRSEQVFHYHRGEPARWRENVPSWDAVVYRNLYDGIDLRVTGKRTGIKFEFIVAPGADWRQISVRYEGIDSLALHDDGSLEIRPCEGWAPITDGAPYIYQEIDAKRHMVEGRFALIDSKTWCFEISGDFDPARQLIIDPDLEWSTYLGGGSADYGRAIAVDGSGNVYVTGTTGSSDFPTPNGWDTSRDGGDDVFVSKFSASGLLLWSTYLGGSGTDRCYGISLDGSANVFITGLTTSRDFPTLNGWDTTFNGGLNGDAFVSKFSASGSLLWSTYLGGTGEDYGSDIAAGDSAGVYVTGTTSSVDFPAVNGWDTIFNSGYYDVFVSRFSTDGSLLWSTYLGGSESEYGEGIGVDGSGNAYITGATRSSDFPTSNGWDSSFNGGLNGDAFVSKFSVNGTELLWSTYLGGTASEHGFAIAVEPSGNSYVTGFTLSRDFPTSNGWDTSSNGMEDVFVSKFSADGSQLLWSSYWGGSDDDKGTGIAVNDSGTVYVTGYTSSSDFPTINAWDRTFNGGYRDAFVASLDTEDVRFLWSTYLGGSKSDYSHGIAATGSGHVCVIGHTYSSDFPTPNGWDTSFSGGFDIHAYDAFVSNFIITPTPTPTPTPSPTPWQIVFDFVSDEEGWTTGGATAVFTLPDFAWEPDFVTMTSRTNTNTFGFWQSPQDAVPADPHYLYRARFNVSTDLTAKSLVPQIRLGANSLNLQQYDVLSIESAGGGDASPEPAGTNYDLYFVPPANDTSVMLAFDLLNFNPFDAAEAELALDTVTVYRFALDSLSTPTLVQDYTFELSTDGWTTGGAPIAFSPPQYIHAAGALELHALTNTNTFGYWVSDPADITIEADKLYRGTFEVRTDVTNPALVPEMRLRFNTGNFQASSMLGIVSSGDGANSPGVANTTYDRLYFLPPVSCAGQSLIVSFDILNFDLGDATPASLILDRATIETLAVPSSP